MPLGENPMTAKGGVYTLDFDDFEKKLRQEKPSVFLLVIPHNPTGRVFSQAVLENWLRCTKNTMSKSFRMRYTG